MSGRNAKQILNRVGGEKLEVEKLIVLLATTARKTAVVSTAVGKKKLVRDAALIVIDRSNRVTGLALSTVLLIQRLIAPSNKVAENAIRNCSHFTGRISYLIQGHQQLIQYRVSSMPQFINAQRRNNSHAKDF